MKEEEINKIAEEKIKEMFPTGYCVSGNYEGYKNAIVEGIKIGSALSSNTQLKEKKE